MSGDLVRRLRLLLGYSYAIGQQAADRIEELERQRDMLRQFLFAQRPADHVWEELENLLNVTEPKEKQR